MFLSCMHDITRNQLSWPFYYKKCEAMQLFPSYLKNEGTALEMQMKKTAQYSEKVDIGLGWLIFYDGEGNPIYWHNGGTGGYSSDMAVSVENQKSVIILSNVSAFVKETRQYQNLNFTLI